MRQKRENTKLLKLSSEEKNMLGRLAQKYGLDESQVLRLLIRKEYEREKEK